MRAEGTAERAAEGRCGAVGAGGVGAAAGELEVEDEFKITGAAAGEEPAARTGASSAVLALAAAVAGDCGMNRWCSRNPAPKTTKKAAAIAMMARFWVHDVRRGARAAVSGRAVEARVAEVRFVRAARKLDDDCVGCGARKIPLRLRGGCAASRSSRSSASSSPSE